MKKVNGSSKEQRIVAAVDLSVNHPAVILIGGEQKNQSVKTDGVSTCLCSSMGCGGGYVPMIVLADNKKQETRNKKQDNMEWTCVLSKQGL